MATYPSLNFQLGDTVELLRETVPEFDEIEMAPRAAEMDQNNEL